MTPALFVLAAIAIVFSVIRVSPLQSAIGAALMVAGVPAFYYWKSTSESSGSLHALGEDPPARHLRSRVERIDAGHHHGIAGRCESREAFDISGPKDEGFMPLREAIARAMGQPPTCVSIAAGASGANFQAMLALLEPGDDALIETPAYDPLIAAARAAGANVVHFERSWKKGFALDPYVIRTALTPATKLIVISNAHNPSGAMAPRDVLEQIGVMAEAIGARVLVDEVYAEAQHDDGADAAAGGDASATCSCRRTA